MKTLRRFFIVFIATFNDIYGSKIAAKSPRKNYTQMASINYEVITRHKRQDNRFPISIRVHHASKRRYIPTGYFATASQITSDGKIKDRALLTIVLNIISKYESKLQGHNCEDMSVDAIVTYITAERINNSSIDFIQFAQGFIDRIKANRPGSAANFQTIVNNLRDFIARDVLFTSEINRAFIKSFIDYLKTDRIIERKNQFGKIVKVKKQGVTNTYNKLKDFKTLFNEAKNHYNNEDFGINPIPHSPFQSIDVVKPLIRKKAYTIAEITRLYKLFDKYSLLTKREKLALDMFFLSFFMCGINEADLYSAKQETLKNGRFSYNRAKTKNKRADSAYISIKVEDPAMNIIEKYRSSGPMLFPFSENYSDCRSFDKAIGIGLRSLNNKYLDNDFYGITYYHARHSFATIARNNVKISKDDISLMLNHAKGDVTDIYIKDDFSIIDKANKKFISFFFAQLKP